MPDIMLSVGEFKDLRDGKPGRVIPTFHSVARDSLWTMFPVSPGTGTGARQGVCTISEVP